MLVAPFRPVAGRDYPRNFPEFLDWFSEEERCYAFLERIRWRDGFVCPHCGAQESYWRASRGRRRCTACRKDTSVTAGTVLDKTRLPLRTWFFAAWYVVNQKNGVSALPFHSMKSTIRLLATPASPAPAPSMTASPPTTSS